MAASIQQVLEDVVAGSVRRLVERHGVNHLALAGGVFANVRLNRLLCEGTGVDEVFIFPAMGDEGLTAGGALQFLLERDGLPAWLDRRRRLDNVYWGRDYSEAIDQRLGAHAAVQGDPGDPAAKTVALLQQGLVGAIYEGRMEFGPRALGARSILASPADAAVNARLNARLARTEFMPFAPYVLEEDAASVFEVTDANRYACRFMTITTAVRPEWRARIPAVVHVDGTARPQIIDPAVNPLYARILSGFKAATGLPVLVNTSFNVHEEPIVNTPEECLRALLDERIDFAVTRNGIYRKR
jgi:carbamoyltransferase